MLPTLIQRYDKKSFHFKNERLTEILQAVRCHTYCINTIYQFIKPFLDDKMPVFEEYGAFKLVYVYVCQPFVCSVKNRRFLGHMLMSEFMGHTLI